MPVLRPSLAFAVFGLMFSASPTAFAQSFTLLVSPTPVPVTAGSAGSAAVVIAPVGGFAGTVALTCATGGTFTPAGYTCSFANASVPVSGGQATTQLNLMVSAAAGSAVKVADARGRQWGIGLAGVIVLLGMTGIVAGGGKTSRNFFLAAGLVLGIVSAVLGCGGGGASNAQVATTTTLSSSALKVGFGTPVTFSVLVVPQGSATPTGTVQLFDNGTTFGNATPVNSGVASILTTNLPVGVHVITAQYSGDAHALGSTSSPITQLITGSVPMQITGTSNGIVQTANFIVAVN